MYALVVEGIIAGDKPVVLARPLAETLVINLGGGCVGYVVLAGRVVDIALQARKSLETGVELLAPPYG